MHRSILTTIALLPLLMGATRAEQIYTSDPPAQPFGFPSEDSGTGAYLGVDVTDVSTERLSALKLKEEKGVEVTLVDQDAPAGKAGIKEHDVILSMNGTPIESGAQLRRMIHETPSGRIVALNLSRDGQPLTVKVQLGDRRGEFPHLSPSAREFHVEIPPIPNVPDIEMTGMSVVVVQSSARSGLMIENITPQLGEFFGVKNGNGVLVRSVEKGSRAEKAGLRAGDVIVKINDQPVHDTSDFSHALRTRKGTDAIGVGVIRDKKEQNLNLTLPERKESGELLEEEQESFDPILDADSMIQLSKVKNEIARLRPQIALISEESRDAAREVRKSTCAQQKQMREQTEHLRQERPRVQEKMRHEQEKMRHEMRGEWLEI
jgi:serine protease Do